MRLKYSMPIDEALIAFRHTFFLPSKRRAQKLLYSDMSRIYFHILPHYARRYKDKGTALSSARRCCKFITFMKFSSDCYFRNSDMDNSPHGIKQHNYETDPWPSWQLQKNPYSWYRNWWLSLLLVNCLEFISSSLCFLNIFNWAYITDWFFPLNCTFYRLCDYLDYRK